MWNACVLRDVESVKVNYVPNFMSLTQILDTNLSDTVNTWRYHWNKTRNVSWIIKPVQITLRKLKNHASKTFLQHMEPLDDIYGHFFSFFLHHFSYPIPILSFSSLDSHNNRGLHYSCSWWKLVNNDIRGWSFQWALL